MEHIPSGEQQRVCGRISYISLDNFGSAPVAREERCRIGTREWIPLAHRFHEGVVMDIEQHCRVISELIHNPG